jgi:hypothetical protein
MVAAISVTKWRAFVQTETPGATNTSLDSCAIASSASKSKFQHFCDLNLNAYKHIF